MKRIVLITTTLVAVLFCCSSFKFGFERLQTISEAISLLGNNKSSMDSYLTRSGFAQDSEYKNIIDYKKSTKLAIYTYTTAYENGKLNVISWNEVNVFTNDIVDELLANKFERFRANPEVNIYGYRNITKNILVTLIINNYSNQVVVTMGPLNSKLPIKKSVLQKQSNNVTFQPNKFFTGTKRFCDDAGSSEYLVTIEGQSITIASYPGKNTGMDKSVAGFIVKGYIKNGKIYTEDPLSGKYVPDLFKYHNNQFMSRHNEDEYSTSKLCK